MSRIVRIWIYRKIEDTPRFDLLSKTHTDVIKHIRGDFEYYELDGENARRSSRKEANQWSEKTGEKIETVLGYPAFMHDQGYRA